MTLFDEAVEAMLSTLAENIYEPNDSRYKAGARAFVEKLIADRRAVYPSPDDAVFKYLRSLLGDGHE